MDRRVVKTKNSIYQAFFRLVQTKAIDDITVSELARMANIDRKTFYLHYQTVQDVFLEFKEMIYTSLMEVLSEADRRGSENLKRLEAGEDLARPNDIAPFDFIYFYDSLNSIMVENLQFFERLSKDTSYMFLKNDFKNIFKQALMDYSKSWEEWLSHYELSLYSEFIAAGAISLWTDWLHHRQVPLEEFRDKAIVVLREAWKMGTSVEEPYQDITK